VDLSSRVVQRSSNSERPRLALFLSRLHKKKGLELLIEAWSRVKPDGWKLVVCGSGSPEYTARLKRLARNSPVSDSISFSGSVVGGAKERQLAASDLFILPTMSENFGLVVAEALAHGVPVVTTHGAPWQELEEYRCGWWTAIGVAPLCEAIREATSMPGEELATMGRRGRILIGERYSWKVVAPQMIDVYRWLVRGGSLPHSMENDYNVGVSIPAYSRKTQ
jgi:glycosyltransferase involved in cell wall biosynthesis